MKHLDVESVHAFVLVADLNSFTRAAEGLGLAQSAVSLKIKRLEAQLGRRLFDRHPRLVRLSAEGAKFLAAARAFLAAHETALSGFDVDEHRLAIGISDHVAGPFLPDILARFGRYDPRLTLSVHVHTSRELVAAYDNGGYDAVIVRREGEARDGETLGFDALDWFAAPDFDYQPGTPLRLANLEAPCGMRSAAMTALDQKLIPWREVFIGGGVSAVSAAVTSGFAVAALARRVAPIGAISVSERFGLPPLPRSETVLYEAARDARSRRAIATLAALFRHGEWPRER